MKRTAVDRPDFHAWRAYGPSSKPKPPAVQAAVFPHQSGGPRPLLRLGSRRADRRHPRLVTELAGVTLPAESGSPCGQKSPMSECGFFFSH